MLRLVNTYLSVIKCFRCARQINGEAVEHLEKVRDSIEGFETPYGLELLATVHWVVKEKQEIQDDAERIVEAVHNWNERKREVYKEKHIVKAWEHLKSNELINFNF